MFTTPNRSDAAGVLPVTVDPATLKMHVILGKEAPRTKPSKRNFVDTVGGTWCDFGGRYTKGDGCFLGCAAREWLEESMGAFLPPTPPSSAVDALQQTRQLITSNILCILETPGSPTNRNKVPTYITFVVFVPWNDAQDAVKRFDAYRSGYRTMPQLVSQYAHNPRNNRMRRTFQEKTDIAIVDMNAPNVQLRDVFETFLADNKFTISDHVRMFLRRDTLHDMTVPPQSWPVLVH